ncbi:hypothetical protein K502DRAFT_349535 [Neoconidiobolus thromboides FSU 785]|nr:hypothetical protein K502DRAFT_349535 [Neoconidiobolus thromboides FSU 785]
MILSTKKIFNYFENPPSGDLAVAKLNVLKAILRRETEEPITLEEYIRFVKHILKSPEYINFLEWYTHYQEKFERLPLSEKKKVPLPPTVQVGDNSVQYSFEKKEISESSSASSTDVDVTQMPLTNEIEYFKREFLNYESENGLNINSLIKRKVLTNLSQTTHPEALRELEDEILKELSLNSIDRFLKYSVYSVNYGRAYFVILFNHIFFLCIGIALMFVLFYCIYGEDRLFKSYYDTNYWYRIIPMYFLNMGLFGLFFLNMRICPVMYASRIKMVPQDKTPILYNRIFGKVEDPLQAISVPLSMSYSNLTSFKIIYYLLLSL